jgi:DNA-3-methyladenine glycosylase I
VTSTEPSLPSGLLRRSDGTVGCWWGGDDPLYRTYHDHEWGMPVTDEVRLFEKLCLEGFQAGLAWITILRKREGFRTAFAGFHPEVVAAFGPDDVERMLGDAGIVRHRGKIEATISNANRVLELRATGTSLATLLWGFEPGPDERPPVCDHATLVTMATTPASRRMSATLRGHGFRFVGPTTMYALMQAMGMVNDHVEGCPAREVCDAARAALRRP